MVSLPDIFQGGGQSFSDNASSGGSSTSNVSAFFCNDCTYDLSLPVRKINQNILREYEEKYAQIRYMQRLLCHEETTLEDVSEVSGSFAVKKTSTFRISNNTKENLQIYALGFPLIRQSRLLPPHSEEFNFEHLRNKILKRQSRNNTLHRAPRFGREEKTLRSKYVRSKVRQLPSLKSQKWDVNKYSLTRSPPRKVLSADPEEVVFGGFEIGGYYEKKCKITNVSCGKCRFKILPMDNASQFRVVYSKATSTLAAGLSFLVTIQFYCRSVADCEESLVITSTNGEDLVVSIKAESDPPCLIEVVDTACNLDEVVDSLVDCGSHFVGEKSKLVLTLKNVGSAGRFCFITDSDWSNLELSLDSSNTLVADPFRIQPMYFSLGRDQEITIYVSAVPPSDGLHTTGVLLLCQNGSLNWIDFVCDGLLFEPSLIDHLDMEKTFDVDIQDIASADCYLDFGRMLTFDHIYSVFFLFNTASVSMSYHWELRAVAPPGTEALPEVALSIIPMRGRLGPRATEMFCLRATTDVVPPGVYRSLLVLVIDDLPKKCIPLQHCDKLLPPNEEDDGGLRSIEAKHIEVGLECVSPSILLIPYVIDFTDFPLVSGSTIEQREIIIKNESPGKLLLTWNCFEEECSPVKVAMKPSSIQLDEYSTFACTLSVQAVQEGPFELSFWCTSDKRDAKVELLVKGLCCKPPLTTLTDSIDFGLVKIGSHQTTATVAKNCSSSDSLQWTIEELFFRSPDEGLATITDAPISLSTDGGEFCHKNSEILVSYQLACQEDTLWCSVLDWDNNFIPVTADIQTPDVSLSTYTLSADPLYLSVVNRTRVTVSNHSLIGAAVFWGCPTDQKLETVVTVEVEPRCFVLEPGRQEVVEVRITPNEAGPLEDLYIPCFVESNPQPLLLKVEGNVESLRVRVEWDSKDQHCRVIWPPEHELSEESGALLEKTACMCPPHSPEVSEISLNVNCDIFTLNSGANLTSDSIHEESVMDSMAHDLSDGVNDQVSIVEEGVHDQESIVEEGVHDQESIVEEAVHGEEDNISTASTIPYLNWPIVGGRYTRDAMDEEWESHLNNLFILEELGRESNDTDDGVDSSLERISLCFHDIPVSKAITQTIYIRNDTGIPSSYEASVVHNFERIHKPDKPPDSEIVLKKIKGEYDEFAERASPHRGLTVFVSPGSGELAPHDYATLSVTVFARSWGRYSDMLVLQVGDLAHLCVRLSVSVSQPPVVAPRQIGFGSIPDTSPPVTRCFKLENVSTVPVYVCWDVFTSSSDKFPFSAALFDSDPFDLKLTEYYGTNSPTLFQTKEKYTLLEPNSSKTMEVKFDPNLVNMYFNRDEFINTVQAVLTGHIYITDEGRRVTLSENCIRVDGSKLLPLRVNLEVRLREVPLLSLLNVFNYQLSFKCTAYDVMKTKDKIWNSKNVVRVQNNSETNLEAKVYTVGFFNATKIEYLRDDEKHKKCKDCVALRPGETCEVTIVCEVTESDLLACFDTDTDSLEEEAIGVCSVEKGLLCFEQNDVRQEVQLELWLYPPLLHFSETSLNFGTVYIEDTYSLILNITAPMNEEYFEVFIKSGKNNPFFINKTSGVLKPKIGCLLRVFFSPSESTLYQDTLVVRACLDKMCREIPLTGIGTFDYRAHTY